MVTNVGPQQRFFNARSGNFTFYFRPSGVQVVFFQATPTEIDFEEFIPYNKIDDIKIERRATGATAGATLSFDLNSGRTIDYVVKDVAQIASLDQVFKNIVDGYEDYYIVD